MRIVTTIAILLAIASTSMANNLQNRSLSGEKQVMSFDVTVGMKSLDSTDWERIEDQISYGFRFSIKPQDWPVSIAADLSFSEADDTESISDPFFGNVTTEVAGSTMELLLGVRHRENFKKGSRWYYSGAELLV